MNRLLYIKASPRGSRSHSVAVADAFVEQWKAVNPGAEVAVRNLFEMDLPPFDGDRIMAKYNIMHGRSHSLDEKRAWTEVEAVIEDFASFHRYAFAVPMWNFGVPYRLKQYFDIIVQPGYTVGMNEKGYFGMLEGKKAFVAYASGGTYAEGNPVETWDYQSTWLRMILGFIGITDVVWAEARGMLLDGRESRRSDAVVRAAELARGF
ncbi:NAD(P)H-dependent oxidoreductase [Desulfocurvus sp.]|uniref:FMN-dependent NADH-azoreductase n=1 Tax=Desulfocurvus sp. TaxID=2871698 RepID=UPI0025C2CE5C|nr:NAD(P)H-dependent oxidoreductase [Desulfocurvus sp.]MCK9239415.1 NAD(P)H-dependent oxidoreductase [Desulfocurvus sp.]